MKPVSGTVFINRSSGLPDLPLLADTVYRAGWVIVDPWTIIENGFVRVLNGTIAEVGKGRGPVETQAKIDCGPGAIFPGMVNAHTHLELTALGGETELNRGLIDWVESVVRLREEKTRVQLLKKAAEGLDHIRSSGTVLIGEIASLGITHGLFQKAPVGGVWFREYLGTAGPEDDHSDVETVEVNKRFSVAGHAPHTTAPDLLVTLKKMADKVRVRFGLHLAESPAEVEFLENGQGEWADFMARRGIDTGRWPSPGKRPVAYCDGLELLNENTLAVHLLECDKKDLALIADRGTRVCLCPRSNMALHGKLPDIAAMLKAGIQPCLGTDSLASNDSLSISDEMGFVARKYSDVSPADILAMATINGAAALGFKNRFGRLAPGASARFLYTSIDARTAASLLETIVNDGQNMEIIPE